MNEQRPSALDMAQQIAITLPLGTWDMIIGVIAKNVVWDQANPLIIELRKQLHAALNLTPDD